MRFDGDIIITDPCYIIKKEEQIAKELGKPIPEYPDYKNFESITDYQKACTNYHKKAREFNHWEQCDYGENMEVLGITHYISKDTIYGDWSCTTYQHDFDDPKELIRHLYQIYDHLAKCFPEESFELEEELDSLHLKDIGHFCADAGMVAVFYLDEVLKYNPDFDYHIERPWTTTLIKDFHGEVEYYVDVDEETTTHIIGAGNINFITVLYG